jgi:hypothetical protein
MLLRVAALAVIAAAMLTPRGVPAAKATPAAVPAAPAPAAVAVVG